MAGEEAIWFNAKQAGVTPTELFKPLPKEKATPNAIRSIAEALQTNVGQTRQSGHNIIFASIAIRALHDHPEFATPQVVAGIRKLIEGFNNAHAGRGYYGKEKGWLTGNQVKLTDYDFPAYKSIPEMVSMTITELIHRGADRKQGFGDCGISSTTPLRSPRWTDWATRNWQRRHCLPITSTSDCGNPSPMSRLNSAPSKGGS